MNTPDLSKEARTALLNLLYETLIAVRNTVNLQAAKDLGYMAHNIPGILSGKNSLDYFVEVEAPHWLEQESIPESVKSPIEAVVLAADACKERRG